MVRDNGGFSGFRLLAEYHSFLYSLNVRMYNEFSKSFRLLAEYHSFLYKKDGYENDF